MSAGDSTSALASEALRHFTVTKRGDESILTLKDDRPEWVFELVHSAHGDMLPDDFIYNTIHGALVVIARAEDGEYLDDLGQEFAGDVDIMNSDLLEWVSSNLNRMGYVDEALEERRPETLAEALMGGQECERYEVFDSVRRSLEARCES